MEILEKNSDAILQQAYKYLPTFKQVQNQKGNLGLIEFAFELVDKILVKSEIFKKASCNKTCSFCCHSEINMSKYEMIYIKSKIIKNNIIPNQERKKLQMENPNNELNYMDKACPFLSDENSTGQRLCSIYEFRPIICRTHNSLSEIRFCNKEAYPNKSVKEVRTLESEAVFFALLLLDNEKENNIIPKLYQIHNL